MMEHDLIRRVVEDWERRGIELLPGIEKNHLIETINGMDCKVSRDVMELYTSTGGFAEYETDEHLWSLWSLSRLVSENADYERPYILFADWAVSAWCYCFRYESEQTSSILVDYFDGTNPRIVSPSVDAFFSQYLQDASKITDSSWLNRSTH